MTKMRRQELGPYRLDVLLGRGGMGEVYKAWDQRLERWVAIKHLLAKDGQADAESRARFRTEAKIAAGLGHPAIIQIFDILEEDGDDWIIMELVDGPDLAKLVRDGPLDVGLTLDYGRQIASALAAAHGAGVVHRDLKTDNVMVHSSGHVKVLDFGLARSLASGNGDAGPTAAPGLITGTPRAMSPEQARGREVDASSDLFSLGVLLYELLTARSPFRARSLNETLTRVLTHIQPPVDNFDPRIPAELSKLVDNLLEKEPSHRPSDAEVVAEILERIASGGSPTAISVQSGGGYIDTETLTQAVPVGEAVIRTLLVSDLVGSKKLAQRLGAKTAGTLLRDHDRMARDLVASHDGTKIEGTGGSLLFERPRNALGYALAYHQALAELSSEPAGALTARVGIHLGEVILLRNPAAGLAASDGLVEVAGIAKPTAMRLASIARGGQTLLTRAAYDVARSSFTGDRADDLRWLSHGPYRFHGIAEEIDVFEVGLDGQSPLMAPAGSDRAKPAGGVLREETRERDAVALREGTRGRNAVALRSWPPPELPEEPYPVLLPYTHPALIAGREEDIEKLLMQLRMPVPILGLGAPSGTGKSSLLLGSLVPALRSARGSLERSSGAYSSVRAGATPVALVRHPQEPGVAGRLLGDLLDGIEGEVEDGDWAGFVARLVEVECLAGKTPLLVLDQFEDVLRVDAVEARARLGVLLAATSQRRPGIDEPFCRWLLAYRSEYHGEVLAWLQDVLFEVRAGGRPMSGVEVLPHDLSGPDRFHSLALAPLATPPPAGDALAEATRVFKKAIEMPLKVSTEDGRPRYGYRFAPGHAERLARTFAEARLARPDAPLAPELQVVLAHLLGRASADGLITVPEALSDLVEEALADHLRRALEAAFPTGARDAQTGRTKALLALRELATVTGQRDDGINAEELTRAIGDDGDQIMEQLATPLTRLVILQDSPEGLRYVLSHDRLAEVVVRMVDEQGIDGKLLVDAELLALRRFVALKTALQDSQPEVATRIPRGHFKTIDAHAQALIWDDERRTWWAACKKRRRADRRRSAAFTAMALMFLTLVTLVTWNWVQRRSQHQALRDQVVQGEPGEALEALDQLLTDSQETPAGDLLSLLRRREVPMDPLEQGLVAFESEQRSGVVLRAVEIALPWVAEAPDDSVLIANLVWALDYGPGRDPAYAARARDLRDRVLEPLRKLHPPPPVLENDPDWVSIPAGSVRMGSPEGVGRDNEHPRYEATVAPFRILRHEVTNAAYRQLVPDYRPADAGDLPATFINYYDAYTYAAWLGGRLPTEAEWEYAARAGCPHTYCSRDGLEATVDDVAWTLRNSVHPESGDLTPSPVMTREPNPWGLFDMLGNLQEWTMSWYATYPAPSDASAAASPVPAEWWGPATGVSRRRVARGASFWVEASWARFAWRDGLLPRTEDKSLGFRVVIVPD